MQKSNPFARALAMMHAFASIATLPLSERQVALANIGGYVSRGHGRGKRSGKKSGNHCTNWNARLNGQTNGKRECERRMRQIASGMLTISNGVVPTNVAT